MSSRLFPFEDDLLPPNLPPECDSDIESIPASHHPRALLLCAELEFRLQRPDILAVPNAICAQNFKNKSTVGVLLNGTVIDNMVIGGPAYNSGELAKGDVIMEVDGKAVTEENIHDALLGSDVPGTAIVVKVKRSNISTNQQELSAGADEVQLTRMASETIADRRKMFEHFTSLKEQAVHRNDTISACAVDETINLWTNMLKADAKHFDEIAYNVTQMQQDCIVMLSELRECIIINESLYRSGTAGDGRRLVSTLQARTSESQTSLAGILSTDENDSRMQRFQLHLDEMAPSAEHALYLNQIKWRDAEIKRLNILLASSVPHAEIAVAEEVAQICRSKLERLQVLLIDIASKDDTSTLVFELERARRAMEAMVPRVELDSLRDENEQHKLEIDRLQKLLPKIYSLPLQDDLQQVEKYNSRSNQMFGNQLSQDDDIFESLEQGLSILENVVSGYYLLKTELDAAHAELSRVTVYDSVMLKAARDECGKLQRETDNLHLNLQSTKRQREEAQEEIRRMRCEIDFLQGLLDRKSREEGMVRHEDLKDKAANSNLPIELQVGSMTKGMTDLQQTILGMVPAESHQKVTELLLVQQHNLAFISSSISSYLRVFDEELNNLAHDIQQFQRKANGTVFAVQHTIVQDKLKMISAENQVLKSKILTMIPADDLVIARKEITVLQTCIQEVRSRETEARAEAAKAKHAADELRQGIPLLQKQVAQFSAKLSAMVPREELLSAQKAVTELQSQLHSVVSKEMAARGDAKQAEAVAEELRQANAALMAQVSLLAEKDATMVSTADLETAVAEASLSANTLGELRRALASTGLSDTTVLTRYIRCQPSDGAVAVCELLERLRGPPTILIVELCEFLDILKESGPMLIGEVMPLLRDLSSQSQRPIAEVRRLLHIVNLPPAMSTDELSRLRTLVRGAGAVGVDELEGLAKEGWTVEGVHRLREEAEARRKEAVQSENQRKRLQGVLDGLTLELISVRIAHKPILSAPLPEIFSDTLHVRLLSCDAGAVLYYTTDGREPGPYTFEGRGVSPLDMVVSGTCVLKVVAECEGRGLSGVVSHALERKDAMWERQKEKAAECEDEHKLLRSQLGHYEVELEALSRLYSSEVETAKGQFWALHSELDGLKGDIANIQGMVNGMVPRVECNLARDEALQSRGEIQRLKRKMANMVSVSGLGEALDENKRLVQEVENIRRRLNEMVPKEELSRVQQEAEGLRLEMASSTKTLDSLKQREAVTHDDLERCRAEVDQLRSAMHRMVARGAYDRVVSDLSYALDDVARLQKSVAGMVFKSDLARAEDEIRRLSAELGGCQAILVAREKELETMRGEVSNLQGEVDRKIRDLMASVPRQELTEARSEANRARIAVEELKDQKGLLENQVEQLRGRLSTMVPQVELAAAEQQAERQRMQVLALREELSALKDEVEDKREQTRSLDRFSTEDIVSDVQHRLLENELKQTQAEIQVLRVELHRIEQRPKQEAAKIDSSVLNNEVDVLKTPLLQSVPKESVTKLQAEADILREEVRRLEQALADSVTVAERAQVEGVVEKSRLETETDGLLELTAMQEARFNEAQAVIKQLRSELDLKNDHMLGFVSREQYISSMAEASSLKLTVAEMQHNCVELESQIQHYKSILSTSVPKGDLQAALENIAYLEGEISTHKQQLAGLSSSLFARLLNAIKVHPKQSAHMICLLLEKLKDPPESAFQLTELCEFLDILKESGPMLIGEVMPFLRDLSSKSQRPIAEVRRLLHIVNLPPAMSTDELSRLRTLVRGAGAVGLDELEGLAKEGWTVEGIHRLREEAEARRKEAVQSENQRKRLQEINECMEQELITHKTPLASSCALHLETTFTGRLTLLLRSFDIHATIYITMDGREPGPAHCDGCGPSPLEVVITGSCVLKAVCASNRGDLSRLLVERFKRVGECVQDSYLPSNSVVVAGVGMLIERMSDDGHIIVKSLSKGGPAEQNGRILPGDLLVAVDGVNVRGASSDFVIRLISGPDGSAVELALLRPGRLGPFVSGLLSGTPFSISLVRRQAGVAGLICNPHVIDGDNGAQLPLPLCNQLFDGVKGSLEETTVSRNAWDK